MKSKIVLLDDNVLVAFKQNNVDFAEFARQAASRVPETSQTKLSPAYELESAAGGMTLFCLNDSAVENLSKQKDGSEDFGLCYYAVGVGCPSERSGIYKACVARDCQTGALAHIPALNAGAINFSFEYEVLEVVQGICLIKITGFVGDGELLRFGLAELGAPVFGDKQYGGDKLAKDTFLALFLGRLRFVSPTDESVRTFVAVPEGKPWTFFDLERWFKV